MHNSNHKKKPIILIPAYQPEMELVRLVEDLCNDSEQQIIVVNDGSTGESTKIFEHLKKYQEQVEILHHAVNLGKGRALKTGFNHFIVNYSDACIGVITADADGQHAIEDIKKVFRAFEKNPDALHLGSRMFNRDVPLRSKFGNRLTSFVFRLVTGVKLIDTQTGLRGIPREFMPELLYSVEQGYDFELDMLIRATRNQLTINEVPIETIYISENKSSHFNILRDSLKIYFVFIRFLIVSIATAGIDFIVFAIGYWNTREILISIIVARILAGLFQFFVSKFLVFKSKGKLFFEFLKYAALVVSLMMLSYSLITPLVNRLHINPYLSKAIAEGIIFLLSFTAQNFYVYSAKKALPNVKTDWDVYYSSPFRTAKFSRNITRKLLLNLIESYADTHLSHIIELGGGNSSFFSSLREKYRNVGYTVIDNNEYGLKLFQETHAEDLATFVVNHSVLDLSLSVQEKADVVFSVGLIEHFSTSDTAKAIKFHFSLAKPGGIVIITFPTPTWLYIIARKCTEILGAWKFPDERPLKLKEVIDGTQEFGELLHTSINWPIIFTQGVVVVRKTKNL